MRSAILPFRPVLRDFIHNLWYLRFFLFLIVLLFLVSSAILVLFEGTSLACGESFPGLWSRAIGVTLRGFLFGFDQGYVPVSVPGQAAAILNSFIRPILFGVLIWVVQQSLSGHTLKKSRYMLFPTEEEL